MLLETIGLSFSVPLSRYNYILKTKITAHVFSKHVDVSGDLKENTTDSLRAFMKDFKWSNVSCFFLPAPIKE